MEYPKHVGVINTVHCTVRKILLLQFPNKQNEQAVKSLFCANKGRGCDWQGDLNIIAS